MNSEQPVEGYFDLHLEESEYRHNKCFSYSRSKLI